MYSYDANTDSDGNYSVYCSGNNAYDAILTDNGSFESPSTLYIYYDESYGSVVNDAEVEIGAMELTQKYYLSQLVYNLSYYGYSNVTYVNAEEMTTLLSDTSTAKGKGLVIIAGAIPDTSYNGTSSSAIVEWIQNGGSLYWTGEQIGKYISHSNGTVSEATSGYSQLFVNSELNQTEYDPDIQYDDLAGIKAYDQVSGNRYTDTLSLKDNYILYAPDTTAMAAGTYLTIGYTDGQYASITFVQNGSGMVCVLAGDYSNNQRMDFATVVAAGLCYCSEEIDWQSGDVTKGSVSGTFNNMDAVTAGDRLVSFIYIGGDFSVFGKTFRITGA